MVLSIPEVAQRLSVSEARARVLVESGRLPAQRVGGRWLVAEADLAAYFPRTGRPLSSANAWKLALLARGVASTDWHPMERTRLREKLSTLSLAPDPVASLRSWFAKRAEKVELSSSPADLAELRNDPRIRLSGVSHPASGLLSGSEVEAYVSRKDVDSIIRDWFLVRTWVNGQSNVVFHIVDEVPDEVPLLFVAADLAERPGAREQNAALQLIGKIHAD